MVFQSLSAAIKNSVKPFDLDYWHKKIHGNIVCISDYSGKRKEDHYDVFSFLISSESDLILTINQITELVKDNNVRLPRKGDPFEYKNIWKNPKAIKLFPEYLKILESINGLLFVFLIKKKCDIFSSSRKELSDYLLKHKLGKWNPNIAKEMLDTFVLLGNLMSLFPQKNRDFSWLTDRDRRIGDSEEQRFNSFEVFKKVFNLFDPKFSNVNQYIQFNGSNDEKLNAIPDLAAGSLLDVIDNQEKTRQISANYFNWFLESQKMLKTKFMFVDNLGGSGELSVRYNEILR